MTNWKPGALALTVAIVAVACGGSSSSPTAPTAPSTSSSYTFVTASVTPSLLPPGDTASASVWGWTSKSGSPIYGPVPNARWASSNPSVASVSTTGEVTAHAPGAASITATSDAGSHSASIRVFSTADIESLLVTCLSPVPVKQGTSCQAQVRTRVGDAPVRATWSSSKPEIASLLASGFTTNSVFINANAPGQTVITATYGTFTASATLEVR
jgi:hypothetical protein